MISGQIEDALHSAVWTLDGRVIRLNGLGWDGWMFQRHGPLPSRRVCRISSAKFFVSGARQTHR